jgi:hypothetical protein
VSSSPSENAGPVAVLDPAPDEDRMYCTLANIANTVYDSDQHWDFAPRPLPASATVEVYLRSFGDFEAWAEALGAQRDEARVTEIFQQRLWRAEGVRDGWTWVLLFAEDSGIER